METPITEKEGTVKLKGDTITFPRYFETTMGDLQPNIIALI